MRKIAFFISLLLFIAACNTTENNDIRVTSPDNKITADIEFDDSLALVYSISYNGEKLIQNAKLGLNFQDSDALSKGLILNEIEEKSIVEKYDVVVGKSDSAVNHYNELTLKLAEKAAPNRKLNLIIRSYNDGVAFRYEIPEQENMESIKIKNELTNFVLDAQDECWALELKNFNTSYEEHYNHYAIGDLNSDTLIGFPLTIKTKNGKYMCITEAALTNYAGMYLKKDTADSGTLATVLSPLPGKDMAVETTPGMKTPWRVIMITDHPGNLITSNLILNLNEPNAIGDTDWIKAGKTAWPWWSGRVVEDVNFEGGMNTETMKYYIDFAHESGLENLLIDALWYGDHTDPSQDITSTIPEIDMPGIIDYANEKGVDVYLWLNWENTRDQMDKAFPLYEEWGVKGIKVDYMNRDDQQMVNFYHQLVKNAAEHHLMVDLHGAYKPTGIRRTYPNLMTREGILGLEYFKWSDKPDPEHNVTVPYTRMVTGPLDYTPCGFDNVTRDEFESINEDPKVMGTRGHHIAMFVVYESPFQMVSDHPASYKGQPGFDFIKKIPATFDETRFLDGIIGDYVVLARRKSGNWYIGGMNDWTERTVELDLSFLGDGQFSATIYSDGENAGTNPKELNVETKEISKQDKIGLKMASGGGFAIEITPK